MDKRRTDTAITTMNNNIDQTETIDEQTKKLRLKNSQQVKAWRAKMTSEKKAEMNQKKRELYRRNKCINEYAASKGITLMRLIILLTVKNYYTVRNIIYYLLTMYHA